MFALEQFVARLITMPPPGSRVHSHYTLPFTLAPSVELPAALPSWLVTMLRTQGIERLAAYQWQALQLWQQGQHVCLSAPTGGGRGVVRRLAMYHALATAQRGHALWIFARKDRELAQLATLTSWNTALPAEHRLTAAIYDGDTPPTERRVIKQSPPQLLLTTPEMLHAGILAYHAGWRAFFQNLRTIVLVDAHYCGGALGAHLTHLLQRLQRLSAHYGAKPQYLVTSAPVANIQDIAQSLTGQSCTVVCGEAFCQYPQSRVILEADGNTELILQDLVERLRAADIPPLISPPPHPPPRGGRAWEGVRSVIFPGLPSSLSRLHADLSWLTSSQAYSVSILILRGETPLERYLLHYPAVYQTPWLQALSLAPRNSQVAQQHLLCAAAELALGAGERYVSMPGIRPLLQHLASTNAIAHRGVSGEWTTTQRQPHRGVRLRAYEPAFALINQYDGQLLTTVAPAQAFRDCFEGAIYHHNGRTFHVERVHTERRRILVRPIQATYLTQGMVKVSITEQRLEAAVSKDIWHLAYGSLTYTETLHAFERLDVQTHRRLSLHVLSASQRQVQTQGVWCEFAAPGARYRVPERVAVHTLVHAILAGLPLLLANNPGRIHGGVHERAPAGPGWRAVFSDADAGGNGVSAFIYGAHEQVWRAGLHVLLHCSCDHGCPRCIAAQPCITCASESTLDRGAGIALLQSLLEEVVPPLEHVRFPGTSSAAEPGTQDTHVPRHLYLCLTTQKSAEEVGGWQHKHLLELGMAVTYNTSDGQYRVYTAETVEALLASLCQADLVIGFNLRDFDYQVLQPCTDTPLATLPTLAILDDIQQGLGFRLSLSHVVHETLGIDRPDDSLQTLHWFRQGEQDRIIQHCRRDVELIRALVQHGATTGSLWYRDHTGERRALPVPWQSAEQHGQSAVQYYLPRNRQPSGTPKG